MSKEAVLFSIAVVLANTACVESPNPSSSDGQRPVETAPDLRDLFEPSAPKARSENEIKEAMATIESLIRSASDTDEPKTPRIIGFIYKEPTTKGSDLVDGLSNPLAGVTVNLLRLDTNKPTLVGSVTTDKAGIYKFSDLEPGTYHVFTDYKEGSFSSHGPDTVQINQGHRTRLGRVLGRYDFK